MGRTDDSIGANVDVEETEDAPAVVVHVIVPAAENVPSVVITSILDGGDEQVEVTDSSFNVVFRSIKRMSKNDLFANKQTAQMFGAKGCLIFWLYYMG